MKLIRTFFLLFLALLIIAKPALMIQVDEEFISFGADLNKTQRDQLYKQFAPEKQPQIFEVTNSEEYHYLSKYIPAEQIGSKAISSVYLKTLEQGAGIYLETYNITWVTSGMYANAAVTAGVKDVLIKASSPIAVSGTAALTGIFKAFEKAQGQVINSARKETAYQELVTTGELGEEVGKEKAEYLVRDVKKEVVEQQTSDPEEIRIIIQNTAKQYNIQLDQQQILRLQQLMEKINSLDLNVQEINNQLESINTRVKGIQEEGKKAMGILERILFLLQQLFNLIVNFFS